MDINAARDLKEEIQSLERRIETLRTTAQNLVPIRDGLPKGKATSSAVERLTVKILDLEENLRGLQEKLDAVKIRLIEEICAAPMTEMERRVLMMRYVSCMRFRDICFELDKSDARVYQWHRAGLEKILNYSWLTVALE